MTKITLAILLACTGHLGAVSFLSSVSAWSQGGTAAFDYYGESVAGVGDVNGDGYPDVLVGAYAASGGLGAAYLYFGGPSGLGNYAAWTVTGTASLGPNFGTIVHAAGDVNKDGYADIVVSSAGNSGAGAVHLFLGGPGGLSLTAAWSQSGTAGSALGSSMASGDFNGDGNQDLAVAALSSGQVLVFLGGPSGLATSASWSLSGTSNANVGSVRDVNRDGYDDLIVGSPTASPNGEAMLFLGGPAGLSASPIWTIDGTTLGSVGSSFGKSVAGAGDVNGDGYADVLVGAPDSVSGTAYLFLGGPGGLPLSPAWTALGTLAGSQFAIRMGGVGDLNKDGYGDIYAGSFSNTAVVYAGGPGGLSPAPAWSLAGAAGSSFGYGCAGTGDTSGSGHQDLLVGAYHASGNAGAAYLFYGIPIAGSAAPASVPAPGACIVFPSPVKGSSFSLAFVMPSSGSLHAEIYNERGDLASSVDQDHLAAGLQSVKVSAAHFAAGAYFTLCTLRLDKGGPIKIPVGKFLVIK